VFWSLFRTFVDAHYYIERTLPPDFASIRINARSGTVLLKVATNSSSVFREEGENLPVQTYQLKKTGRSGEIAG